MDFMMKFQIGTINFSSIQRIVFSKRKKINELKPDVLK